MATATQVQKQALPDFVRKINEDYASKVSHVFVVHGNISDYCDNSGRRQGIVKSMALCWDNFVIKELQAADSKIDERGLQETTSKMKLTRIMATYNLSSGLEFVHEEGKKAFKAAMLAALPDDVPKWPATWCEPADLGGALWVLQKWFTASKMLQFQNAERIQNKQAPTSEILLNVLFTDADALFPEGHIAQLFQDRSPIVCIRAWARDEYLGNRNRIILITRHLSEVHESLRGGGSGINTVLIPKPTIDDRRQWLENFSSTIAEQVKQSGSSLRIGSNQVTKVNMADDFDAQQFAVQSAGMSRRQMEDVIMQSWLTGEAVGYRLVRERKQKALEDEYQGIVDFIEPQYGFEQIGGHDQLKKYFQRKVIQPLQVGDARRCASGMLMTGPPGTGKTFLATAVAKEAKMNFMLVHLDKVFAGLVGQTEKNMRQLIEAITSAAPVIVFVDEIDSVLSSGRTSTGDSGTSARVFNSFMTFMSDGSRAGRVVVIAASNRPDLLDGALIRSGRFDAKVPALPPSKGDAIGRMQILQALCLKHQIKFSKDVAATESTANNGLGRLLRDPDRIWTGAEIEVVLKEAIDNADFADRKKTTGDRDMRITIQDWNSAMDDIIPNTEEVERMTKLSLLYVDHLGYCPIAYRDQAKDKAALREELGLRAKGDDY